MPAGIAWAPAGRSLAIVTRDRTTSRLELLAYPSLEPLAVHESRDLGLDHRGPAIGPDGMTYWTGFDGQDQGVWAMTADGEASRVVPDSPLPFGSLATLTRTDAGLVALGSSQPSSFVVDRIVTVDPIAGTADPATITPARSVSIAEDGSVLLGIDDGSGGDADWQLVRDGVATAVDFGTDVLTAAITPDGERLLFSSNEPERPALQSMLPDGSDARVEIVKGVEPGATVGPDGVLVTFRYPSGMDGPALPRPADSDSWTPLADICFSRATWAHSDVDLPAMAAIVPVEPVSFIDPPGSVPFFARANLYRMAQRVEREGFRLALGAVRERTGARPTDAGPLLAELRERAREAAAVPG
ncbi:MAG: hypothetical protein LH650_10635 [Chloroflexi bacterium]|nr:hypothetical protein [Chloroflexota bacterium]